LNYKESPKEIIIIPPKVKLILDERYHIKKKISQGSFGKIYLGTDLETNDEIVVKLNSRNSMNDHEFEIMEALSGLKGFPTSIFKGIHKTQPYIVQKKLGLNLYELL
jgi:casein kinase 1